MKISNTLLNNYCLYFPSLSFSLSHLIMNYNFRMGMTISIKLINVLNMFAEGNKNKTDFCQEQGKRKRRVDTVPFTGLSFRPFESHDVRIQMHEKSIS